MKKYLIAYCLLLSACINSSKQNTNADFDELDLYKIKSELMFYQLESEGRRINTGSSDFVVQNDSLPKFVFFHTEINCNSCVEEDIAVINEFCDSIGQEHILFLTSYKAKRDLIVFKRINKIKYDVYNVPSTGLPVEILDFPFCFILIDGKAECVFVPIKEDNSHLKRYLKMVAKKYF
jgi:hypothetical protein